jgi:hypothetical protein
VRVYRRSLINTVIVLGIVSLVATLAGCTSSGTDPIVGTWKQDAGIIITMDLKADGTGTMTIDSSAFGPGSSSSPAVSSMPVTWRTVNDTCVALTNVEDNATGPFFFNYDKDNKRLYDTSGRTHLDFKKA